MFAEPAIHDIWIEGAPRLHSVEAGQARGPLVILLHGFPEFWYGWRNQIAALEAAGLHVVVPDQRGYNLSDKPNSISEYSIDKLAADVIRIADHFQQPKFFLAGHDWGGAVAWWTAIKYPERIERLTILNVPHPAVFKHYIRAHPSQMLKSWYMLYFQLPWLPEAGLRAFGHKGMCDALYRSSRPGTFTAADMEHYREAWSQPGALTGMVNWYRGAARARTEKLPSVRVTVPTLILWGARDKFIEREAGNQSLQLCDNGRIVYYENGTHWLQHEEPGDVNKQLTAFFKT